MLIPQAEGTSPVTRSASHVLPEPLLSSRSLDWEDIVVELRRGRDIDVLLPYRDHAVAVILGGGAKLCQCRYGRTVCRTLRSGDVIITPAGEPKRWQHVEDAVAIVLRISPAHVDKVAAEERGNYVQGVEILDNFATRDGYIEEMAARLLKCLEPGSVRDGIYVESLTNQLSLHLLKHYASHGIAEDKFPTRLSQCKLRRAVEYIEDNLHRELALSDIAAELAISPGHFSHAFRQTLGLPPHQYVVKRRIERAKSLLRESDVPISEVANRIGCSSAGNFSVLFQRATGMTPRSYRNG
jgi:AraC family transcriptional regulator